MNRMGRGSLRTNAILNVVKQICTVIFPMITFPYVSRVLGVEAYGKVNTSISLIGYIGLIAGLGVYSYAVREGAKLRDDRCRFQMFANEVFSINVLSTFLAYLLLIIVLSTWEKISPYKGIMVILSLNILLTTLGTDWVNGVYEDYLYMTIRYIVCQAFAILMMFLFVKGPGDITAYAFISNLGTASANVLNIFYIRKRLGIHPSFTFRINISQHMGPIMILFGNMISSMIYLYSDTSMLGIMVGDAAVGYYAVASKIYSLVKQTLNAIAAVATPRFSYQLANKQDRDMHKQVCALFGSLMLFLIPAVVGMICVGRELIVLMSGAEYTKAYSALAILSLALVFSTIAALLVGVVMLAFGKDKEILLATTVSALINLILNLVLIPVFSYNAAAFTTFVSEMVMMIMGLCYTRKLLRIRADRYMLIGLIGGAWVVLVNGMVRKMQIGNGSIRLFLIVFLSISIYGIGLLAASRAGFLDAQGDKR